MVDDRSRSPQFHPRTLPLTRLSFRVLEKTAPSWFVPPSVGLHRLNLLFKIEFRHGATFISTVRING